MIDDCRDVDFLKQSGRCSRAALLLLPAVGDNAAMEAEPHKAVPPKRKRRWFQFSLRSLLIFTVIAAVALGWLGKKIEQKRGQREAVEAILYAGGNEFADYQQRA